MKNVLISFVIGAAVGSGVSALIFKKHYEKIANEEIESVKAMVKKKVDNFCEEHNDILEKSIESNDPEETVERINYANKYKGGEEAEYILNTLAEKEHPEEQPKPKKKGKRKGAKIIKSDDYDGYPQYRKLTVYYYVGDGVIADEYDSDMLLGLDERPIGKYSDYIPKEVIDKYGFIDNDDEGVVFVRNEDVSVDFEVIKDFGTFADIKGED